MNETRQPHVAGLEHCELRRQAHQLVDAIAARPGGAKLLKGVIPTLETFANYKANRRRSR
jgi:hypothetical protein